MAMRIQLDSPPEFYTNLDEVCGRVLLSLGRLEHISAIVVKLEGESKTALTLPEKYRASIGVPLGPRDLSGGKVLQENHKILYRVAQVFPPEHGPRLQEPIYLAPGQYAYPFAFKLPLNNACSDPDAMASLGGIGGVFGYGIPGIRVMDGTRQLLYSHVTTTLPPSFTGAPRMADILYYIKVTVQRPGILKENWRYQVGLKFLPLEPPRPPDTNREAYARRPFNFRPGSQSSAKLVPLVRESKGPPSPFTSSAPAIEMSARLPHPSVLTCNKAIPLRLLAKKLSDSPSEINLNSLQIDLIGLTHVRAQDLAHTEAARWVILTRTGLSIPVSHADDPVDTVLTLPDALWRDVPLPNTVVPSFVACNLCREYQLEVRIGLSWTPKREPGPLSQQQQQRASTNPFFAALGSRGKGKDVELQHTQTVVLPLHFNAVQVYSGVAPPAHLEEAIRQGRGQHPGKTIVPSPGHHPAPQHQTPFQQAQQPQPPRLPVRPPQQQQQQQQQHDPLYPPQLAPGSTALPYVDAPPSYDEAMAEEMREPAARPAYNRVTNDNGPSNGPRTVGRNLDGFHSSEGPGRG